MAQEDDEQRVQRLELGCLYGRSHDVAVHVAVGKEAHRTAGLLEQRPEHDGDGGEPEHHQRTVAVHGRAAGQREPDQTDHHRPGADEEQAAHDVLVLQNLPGDHDRDERAAPDQLLARDPRENRAGKVGALGGFSSPHQQPPATDEREQAGQHPDSRKAEPVAPAVGLAEVAADEPGDERPRLMPM